MPLPHDTVLAVGERDRGKDFRHASRSLMLERFANPELEKDDRRDFYKNAFGKFDSRVALAAAQTRQEFLSTLPGLKPNDLIYAQLRSRLMVNMGGGMMENAGLCLDRFGLPYIPGSAVKGCARRAALAALREWCDVGQRPGATEQDKDNLFKDACAPFQSQAEMLAAIARVFGWSTIEWSLEKTDGRFISDFAWACDREILHQIWKAAAENLAARFGWKIEDEHGDTPWQSLANFAGSVSFLPVYPVDLGRTLKIVEDGAEREIQLAELGKLELDVVTCHHRNYYECRTDAATDTEEPVPVVFPAVAPGHVFTFALVPLRGDTEKSGDQLVEHAGTWLSTGLSLFGLGAKTNAGYGWFVCSEPLQQAVQAALAGEQTRREEKLREAREKADREAARATLQPDPALQEKLKAMKEADLRGQINPFATEERFWIQKDERVQLTLLHFLQVTAPERFAADRSNPKSKIAKAIANLTAKFAHRFPTGHEN